MAQVRPRLVTFGISHFCEKARWALDWHGVVYEEISWPPGVHQILAKRCGAKGTTLPILLDNEMVVQGSGAIIDWADQKEQDHRRKLTLGDASEIEQRVDDVIGFHVRRLGYAEILPRFPHLAKPALFRNSSSAHRLVGNMMWPVTRRVMMRMYDITPEAARPREMPVFHQMSFPDALAADFEHWRDRPVMRWVVTQYQTHRAPRSKGAGLAAA